MTVMVQIRGVPEALHVQLKERAERSGRSLSDYLAKELERKAALPTMAQWFALLDTRSRTNPSTSAADLIRADRDSR
jgi:plasmid stability protein